MRVATTASLNAQVSPIIIVEGDGSSLFGRDLISTLKLDIGTNLIINSVASSHSDLISKFPTLFAPELGCYANATFSLSVDQTVSPRFCKSRPVPYALKSKVDSALDSLLEANFIEPVIYLD